MSVILSIETSTPICSIALNSTNGLIAKTNLHRGMSHSSLLNPAIDGLLKLAEIDLSKISAVAISKGPGSYTGLRIGTSTAKGLCYALNIPLISVETLKAMAFGIKNLDGYLLCPMLDARRMEVYSSVFDHNLKIIQPTNPVILEETSFSDLLIENKVIFFGDGSSKFKDVVQNKNAYFIENITPDAEFIGDLAVTKLLNNEFEDLAYYEPYYLKEFKATKPKSML